MEIRALEIAVWQENNLAIVRVKGRIIRENRDALRAKLEEVMAKGAKGIALDFSGVDYIDSSGLGCCSDAHKVMASRSGALVMFGASPSVEKMWKLPRLDLIIPPFQKEKEALERLQAKTAKKSEAAET
jgi:stage II sporulation protein AA (anti-sigma F factor antagonist)